MPRSSKRSLSFTFSAHPILDLYLDMKIKCHTGVGGRVSNALAVLKGSGHYTRHKPTKLKTFMEQNLCWEANSRAARRHTAHFLPNPKVHYHV
jgi:hypothetical protein